MWEHSAQQGTDQTNRRISRELPPDADNPDSVGKVRQALRTRTARVEPLCSSATCGSIHLLRLGSLRADTQRSLRPRPLPALGGTFGGPRLPLSAPPSPSAAIGHLRGALPPTTEVDWCVGRWEEESRLKRIPLAPAPVEKSRGASLGACHHPAREASLKGPLSLPRSFQDFFTPARGGWHGLGPSYSASRLGADLPSGLLG